ncbi:MAG: hypothetical protein HOY76_30940 [Streptomyces sp.]|nr:hypothetical protein [Streptomyces sp.]
MVARRAGTADTIAKIIASGARGVPGINADIGSDKPHGVHPHALIPAAELGMSHRDVPRSAPSEAADGSTGPDARASRAPGSDADLLALGSSPIDAASAVTDIRAVQRTGHRAG